jgi:hypothetical protein
VLGTEEQKATKAPIKDNNDYHAHSRNTGPSRTQAKRQVIRHSQREAAISRGRAGEEWRETARECPHTARHHRHCIAVDQAEGSGGVASRYWVGVFLLVRVLLV